VRLIFRTGTRTRIYHFENTGCLVPSMDEKKNGCLVPSMDGKNTGCLVHKCKEPPNT
jgi:hypothetical protein